MEKRYNTTVLRFRDINGNTLKLEYDLTNETYRYGYHFGYFGTAMVEVYVKKSDIAEKLARFKSLDFKQI